MTEKMRRMLVLIFLLLMMDLYGALDDQDFNDNALQDKFDMKENNSEDNIEINVKNEKEQKSIGEKFPSYLHIFLSVLDKLLLLVVIFIAIYACCISCPGVRRSSQERRGEERKESFRRSSLRRGSERRGSDIFK